MLHLVGYADQKMHCAPSATWKGQGAIRPAEKQKVDEKKEESLSEKQDVKRGSCWHTAFTHHWQYNTNCLITRNLLELSPIRVVLSRNIKNAWTHLQWSCSGNKFYQYFGAGVQGHIGQSPGQPDPSPPPGRGLGICGLWGPLQFKPFCDSMIHWGKELLYSIQGMIIYILLPIYEPMNVTPKRKQISLRAIIYFI